MFLCFPIGSAFVFCLPTFPNLVVQFSSMLSYPCSLLSCFCLMCLVSCLVFVMFSLTSCVSLSLICSCCVSICSPLASSPAAYLLSLSWGYSSATSEVMCSWGQPRVYLIQYVPDVRCVVTFEPHLIHTTRQAPLITCSPATLSCYVPKIVLIRPKCVCTFRY